MTAHLHRLYERRVLGIGATGFLWLLLRIIREARSMPPRYGLWWVALHNSGFALSFFVPLPAAADWVRCRFRLLRWN